MPRGNSVKRFYISIIALFGSLLLEGCLPTALFSTATKITTSAAQERGVGGVFSDSSIHTRINMAWTSENSSLLTMVEITVQEGRVLLAGHVDTPQQQIDAIRLAWSVDGVREVIDKIDVGESSGVWGYIGDSWITTKLRTEIFGDSDISSINYTIKTVDGSLYIMGIAEDEDELRRVLDYARDLSSVKKVISYVRIKSIDQKMAGRQVAENGTSTQTGQQDQLVSDATIPQQPSTVAVQSLDAPNTQSSFQ